MQGNKWVIILTTTALISTSSMPIEGMEINVGNIRVQTAPNGELYVDTSRGRIYLPSDDDYYEDGDYYDDYDDHYYYDNYCSGYQVRQETVQRSQSGHQESYSRIYTRNC